MATIGNDLQDRLSGAEAQGRPLLVTLSGNGMSEHFTTVLRNAGYPVVEAGSPEEACDLLARQEVALTLVDVEFGHDGVTQITEAARQSSRPSPVGVVVGWWDERIGEVYRMADLLVYKPPTDRQLLTAVESAVTWQPLSA